MPTINHVTSTEHPEFFIAANRLLDSVWCILYTLTTDGRVVIHAHDRGIREGYTRERELPRFQLAEAPGSRIVVAADLANPTTALTVPKEDWVSLPVANQLHVFAYPYGMLYGPNGKPRFQEGFGGL